MVHREEQRPAKINCVVENISKSHKLKKVAEVGSSGCVIVPKALEFERSTERNKGLYSGELCARSELIQPSANDHTPFWDNWIEVAIQELGRKISSSKRDDGGQHLRTCRAFLMFHGLSSSIRHKSSSILNSQSIGARLKDWKRCHDGRRKKEMRKEEVARREEGPLE
ncbi:hypothetical protein M9H77_07294 [Catharanthus roseus]|uniref:Uncharacterized protein n=1 Tax=Catharanthus roseus TaxID=4058 RepID=A0ACC0BUQ0_CATRO|nr:hypothetical protein M9H77_07294 [Catharanthus roseus]